MHSNILLILFCLTIVSAKPFLGEADRIFKRISTMNVEELGWMIDDYIDSSPYTGFSSPNNNDDDGDIAAKKLASLLHRASNVHRRSNYQQCYDAVLSFQASTTDPLCQQIFGWDTDPQVYPNCSAIPHPSRPTGGFPDGSCCDDPSDCASTFCDRDSRTCAKSCDPTGAASQCPVVSNPGDNSTLTSESQTSEGFDDSSTASTFCTNCLCPSTTLCNKKEFCKLCTQYVGPASQSVRLAAQCDITTAPGSDTSETTLAMFQSGCDVPPACLRRTADAVGILAQPDCFVILDFVGLNETCISSMIAARSQLVIGNMTWCEQNRDGRYCWLEVQAIFNAISFGMASTDICRMAKDAGCCLGNAIEAYRIAQNTHKYNFLRQWASACGMDDGGYVKICRPSRDPDHSLGPGPIAGIVIACVVGVAAFVAFVIWCIRRRSDHRRWRTLGEEEMATGGPQQSRVGAPQDPSAPIAPMSAAAASAAALALQLPPPPPVAGAGAGEGGGEQLPADIIDPRTLGLFVGGGDDDEEGGGENGENDGNKPKSADDNGYENESHAEWKKRNME